MIDYSLPSQMNIDFRLYDYLGTEVLSNPQESMSSGQHSSKIETSNLSNGIYILKFKIGTTIISKKIVIL